MTAPAITWRDATEADVPALQQFKCALPIPRQPYRGLGKPPPFRPWEHVAERGIHGMRPPAPDGHLMLIGEDAEGLAAVAWAERIDGPGDVFVKTIGVALRLRHSTTYVGDALLDELQNRLAAIADAAGEEEIVISGKVDPKNMASKHLLSRYRWETFDHDGHYEIWLTRITFTD